MDFEKIFRESLPVEERDAFNAWKKEQEEIAARGPEARRAAAIEKKLNKKAADIAYTLSNFFRNSDIRSKLSYILINNDDYLAMVKNEGIYLYTTFFQLFKKYNIDCKHVGNTSTIEINLYGKREKIGPFYGKLKKLGLNAVREVGQITNAQGYITNHLSVTCSPEEFIEAAKKGLSINDFEMAQWK